MRLEQLYHFVKIADLRSFSAASTELYISQQALSTSIKKIEKYFHTTLFIRTSRGVVLSEDGKFFYEKAKSILATYEQVYNHFLRQPNNSESFSIALNTNVKTFYFSSIIPYFLKNYPEVHIEYQNMPNDAIVDTIMQEKATFGFLPLLKVNHKYVDQFPEHIRFMPINDTTYSVLTSVNSPIANYKSISLSTMVKYPIILNTRSDADLFTHLFSRYISEPNILYVDSVTLQRRMVAEGLGNMLGLQSGPSPSTRINKIPISDDIVVSVGFLYDETRPITTFQKLFIEKSKNLIASTTGTRDLF